MILEITCLVVCQDRLPKLSFALQAGIVAGSIPDSVTDLIFSVALWPWDRLSF